MSGGGSGSLRETHTDYWVWPLPPPGPVRFHCAWPHYGIPESASEIEGEVIREAAQQSHLVWSE